ncbi:MAG: DNA repair protein RecN [Bacteroidales bacterium]|nr:DNA repair protein RecN [Bacteroidales bacterium]
MLTSLQIENYAIIRSLEIPFRQGLTVITGETGAGKSILMGALSLILGNRADTDVLFDKTRKCIVEATFNVSGLNLQTLFQQYDLDYQDETIIRREINEHGKSRAFINDTPVNLATLKAVASLLVDIHSQHQTLMLQNAGFRLRLIDQFAQNQEVLWQYQQALHEWQTQKAAYETLKQRCAEAALRYDYNCFTIEELEKAQLQPDEQTEIEQRIKELTHAETIKSHLFNATRILSEQEGDNILYMLKSLRQECRALESLGAEYAAFNQRIDGLTAEAQDLSYEMSRKNDAVEVNPELTDQLNERLDLLFSLQNKYHAEDNAALLSLLETLQQEVATYTDEKEKLTEYETLVSQLAENAKTLATQLSASRKAAVPALVKAMEERLQQLGMSGSRFTVNIEEGEELRENGRDTATFLFSANAGVAPADIARIASGGEMSRIMLCLKSIITDSMYLPTIIFDEIDTGISGETASKVGQMMRQLAVKHQVIAITHLPQIAACGGQHLLVYKQTTDNQTFTNIEELDMPGRERMIATMMSGESRTESSILAAREMLKSSQATNNQ